MVSSHFFEISKKIENVPGVAKSMDFPFFFLFFRERCRRLVGKSASEAVNFDDTDLKVNAGTQRRIVERQTSFRLSVADVFVDPDRLTFPELDKFFCIFFLIFQTKMFQNFTLHRW